MTILLQTPEPCLSSLIADSTFIKVLLQHSSCHPFPASCLTGFHTLKPIPRSRAPGPDNWKEMEGGSAHWLRTHSFAAAEHLVKPLLVEEFGKKVPAGADAALIRAQRDPVFRSVYSSVEKSLIR